MSSHYGIPMCFGALKLGFKQSEIFFSVLIDFIELYIFLCSPLYISPPLQLSPNVPMIPVSSGDPHGKQSFSLTDWLSAPSSVSSTSLSSVAQAYETR